MMLTVGIKQNIFLDRSPPIFFTVVCLCATKNRHNYLKFCAFAKKNAVSLTNQGCKGCQQCLRQNLVAKVLWHLKNSDLPNAVSQSLRIQLALNSLIRPPVSLAEKHSKAKTGKLSPEFGFAEFWSFVPLQRKTQFL